MSTVTTVVLCACPPSVFAQGAADTRITSGLFSGGNKPVTARQHFDFLFDSSETFDTRLPEQFGPTLMPDNPQNGGYSTLLNGSSTYEQRGRSTSLQASASGAFRYYGSLDEGVNKGIPAFEQALKDNHITYELYMYEGANHAFHNDTAPTRYNEEAAKLAWKRTIEFFGKYVK